MRALQPNVIKRLLLPDDVLFRQGLVQWGGVGGEVCCEFKMPLYLYQMDPRKRGGKFTVLAKELQNRSRFLKNSENCLQRRKSASYGGQHTLGVGGFVTT